MKQRILALTLALALVLGISAQAASSWAIRTTPKIQFSGTTATCTVTVRGETENDKISVRAKLWQGSTCLKDWQASGTSNVTLQETATVKKGVTYKLTADVTVNGVKQTTKSTTATCP